MFKASAILFIYAETPLHAGTGSGLGAIDLPIQRERITGYPIIQASGLKGALRAEAERIAQNNDNNSSSLTKKDVVVIFGPDTKSAHEHAGALSVGDARILLFPVRSVAGVFAWTTSINALERFQRDLAMTMGNDKNKNNAYKKLKEYLDAIRKEANGKGKTGWALIGKGSSLIAGSKVMLEEFALDSTESEHVTRLGDWLADNALPSGDEYAYWHEAMPLKLAVLAEDDFRDFCKFGTEVVNRIKIDSKTKTVGEEKGLWSEEYLPSESLLYATVLATDSRKKKEDKEDYNAEKVLGTVSRLIGATPRLQLGGNETVGRGLVYVRMFHSGQGSEQ